MGVESMLNALRLTKGFDPDLLSDRTGVNIGVISAVLFAVQNFSLR